MNQPIKKLKAKDIVANWTVQPEQRPHICPVCDGRGKVFKGFYSLGQFGTLGTDTAPEECRSCFGRGLLWG